jgi:adenine-specific DNA-methyltransferase
MPTLDWLDRQAAFSSANKTATHVLRPHAAGHVFGDATAARDNLLIQGDNLQALKALLPFYRGKVKCIFIDPPYNTKSAFEHYDDNLEHSQWLSMMLPRLQVLRDLLSEDGSIWVTIDDNEGHYLKVMMDEVFGRGNFVANVVWEKSDSPKMDSQLFSSRHDHLFVFCKNITSFALKRLNTETAAHYDKTDESGRLFYLKPLRAMGGQGDSREARPNLYFPLIAPDGTNVYPVRTDGKDGAWRWSLQKVAEERSRIEWRKGKTGWSAYFRIYADTSNGRPAETIWPHAEVGSNRTSKAEVKALLADDAAFSTPKPEGLLQRVLHLATNPGDLVLDSFLGSGTSAAVAHKMGRRWIGIEMGEHATTHCTPRLQKVIDGEQGGISTSVGWKGGGGFQLLQLGAPLFDEQGDIHPEVRFADLAAFIWMRETGTALPAQAASGPLPLLGAHEGTAYYLLFNGILGDRRPASGNVLTTAVLQALNELCGHDGPKVIYGEACRLGDARLKAEGISFKQLPHAVPR